MIPRQTITAEVQLTINNVYSDVSRHGQKFNHIPKLYWKMYRSGLVHVHGMWLSMYWSGHVLKSSALCTECFLYVTGSTPLSWVTLFSLNSWQTTEQPFLLNTKSSEVYQIKALSSTQTWSLGLEMLFRNVSKKAAQCLISVLRKSGKV